MNIKFSIIVVCLNPGEKLNQTLDSILKQTYTDFEIVVKDGGSKDGSIEGMRQDAHIRFYHEKDSGIYDAMNQAVAHAEGDFVIFMNCGDVFRHDTVLEEVTRRVKQEGIKENMVLYGDTYSEKNDVLIISAPEITGFTCYRNIPCHQSCFYATRLCKDKPYDEKYRIRADYDHFLWCFYVAKAKMIRLDMTVSSYEGGGYSESKENRKRDKEEHKQITGTYMSKGELLKYRTIMLCTLAPVRSFLAENKLFSGAYHWLKECLYHRK
uniref:glycosyltransferase n=1 Tax=Acetatifactor sp. TaxID=1872090 RepID=UPI004057A78C